MLWAAGEYLPESRMSGADRDLAANAETSIREAATVAGFEFGKGGWSYQQLVCQALPEHLFLLYEWNYGAGDKSLFSAAIARGGAGRVHIIPIERGGYAPFSPAPVNAFAIASFNRIRAGEPASNTADWLSTALCYAALTGAHPLASPLHANPLTRVFPCPSRLSWRFKADGESTVRFVDVSTAPRPMEWVLTFDSKGQLIKVGAFPRLSLPSNLFLKS